MKIINSKNAPEAIGPYSQAVKFGDFLFTSGQIALKNGEISGDIESQTKQVLENLKAILNEAGGDFKNVIKTTIFLADMADFAVVNEIYATYFCDHKPARSTISVKGLPKNALIEIELIANLS